jgi:hypothetical protein
MNRPETLSHGVLIAWTISVGTDRLSTRAAIISQEKNNEPNFTLRDIPFSFSASAPLADDWRRQAKL